MNCRKLKLQMDTLVLLGSFALSVLLHGHNRSRIRSALSAIWSPRCGWAYRSKPSIAEGSSDGMDDFRAAGDPVLHPGRRDHGRRRHGRAHHQPRARYSSASIRGGLAHWSIFLPQHACFGCISGSSVADTASIGSVMIPQMIKSGYPRLFAVQRDDLRVAAAAAHPAIAQHGDLFARRGRLRCRSRTCSSAASFQGLFCSA